jgi:hypothetical protein
MFPISTYLCLLFLVFISGAIAENNSPLSNEIPFSKAKEVALYWRKKAAELACKRDSHSRDPGNFIDATGTWCLAYVDPKRKQDYHYRMWPESAEAVYGKQPDHHVIPDEGLSQTILKYLLTHEEIKKKNEKLSLLDIGSGVGQYGIWIQHNELAASKISWQGFDGAGNVESFTNGRVKWIDVTSPLFDSIEPSDFRADFILSLEIGEHIPPETTDTFLNLLDKHVKYGIILSWGIPG